MKTQMLLSLAKTGAFSLILALALTGCSTSTERTASNSQTTASSSSVDDTSSSATDSSSSESILESNSNSESTNSISGFEDINTDKVSLVALGNSDVPVGQYSEEILKTIGIWDDIQSKISYGTNVKEVLSQVSTGSVDCGIVYATDANTDDDVKIVSEAESSLMASPVLYPAAVTKISQNPDAANAFLNFLLTDEAKTEFENVGFKMNYTGEAGETAVNQECTLNIFAAASLTESLTKIGDLFMAENSDVTLVFNFDSSGTLQTQIESGADVDIFISAAQKQMKALSEGGYISDDTKIDLLENKVVLIVPKD